MHSSLHVASFWNTCFCKTELAQARPEKASQRCPHVARASISCNWWPSDSLGAGQSSARAVAWRMQHVMLHSSICAVQPATWHTPEQSCNVDAVFECSKQTPHVTALMHSGQCRGCNSQSGTWPHQRSLVSQRRHRCRKQWRRRRCRGA